MARIELFYAITPIDLFHSDAEGQRFDLMRRERIGTRFSAA